MLPLTLLHCVDNISAPLLKSSSEQADDDSSTDATILAKVILTIYNTLVNNTSSTSFYNETLRSYGYIQFPVKYTLTHERHFQRKFTKDVPL